MPDIKFCGLTRQADAAFAARLGAAYVGVIFAGGPRELSPGAAAEVLAGARGPARCVGVFGADFRVRMMGVLDATPLDVVQLHGDPQVSDVADARRLSGGAVWAAVRLAGAVMPPGLDRLFGEADGVLLDARVPGGLGGTGTTLPWATIAPAIERARAGGFLILAGGLSAENVGEAVGALRPDVVDVSSGVESAPGIKDHERMTAFARAARGAAV